MFFPRILVDEFTRIVMWVNRIGSSEVLATEISRNTKKAKEVISLLSKYGLVRESRKGRLRIVSLSPKGLEVYRYLEMAKRVVYGEGPAGEPVEEAEPEVAGAELPSFARDNPWLKVLAEKVRPRVSA